MALLAAHLQAPLIDVPPGVDYGALSMGLAMSERAFYELVGGEQQSLPIGILLEVAPEDIAIGMDGVAPLEGVSGEHAQLEGAVRE